MERNKGYTQTKTVMERIKGYCMDEILISDVNSHKTSLAIIYI